MLNDPRKILLLNRITIMNVENLKEATQNFPTHVHMSWPNFYNSFAHLPLEDANVLLFSRHTHYDNTGVLLDIQGVMSPNSLLSDMEVPNGSESIH